MSLCLIKYADKDTLLVGADSRACTYSDANSDIKYVTSDNVKKLIPIDNMSMAFVSGTSRTLLVTLKRFKEYVDDTCKDDVGVLAKIFKEVLENEEMSIRNKLHAILYFTVEEGNVGYWLISNSCNFVPIYIPYSENAKQAIIGAYTDELAGDYYSQIDNINNVVESLDVFKDIFQKANSYEVGGTADIYLFTPNGITKVDTFEIKDVQEYRKLKRDSMEMYNLKGLNIDGNFIVDSSGRVTLKKGSLTAPYIKGGTIEGGTIIGGSIESETTIDVNTDAKIGSKLIINANNFLAGIEWQYREGGKPAEIYIDPASKALFINADGGIYINGVEYSPYARFGE